MNLHEYQAKQLLNLHDLPVPAGYVCNTPHEIKDAISKIGSGPWVVKCQIHAGGRSKAGGIKIVNSEKEIYTFIEYWLGKRLITHQTNSNGQPVNQVLVEKAIDIVKELYISTVVDYSSKRLMFITSSEGGVEIEKVSEITPHLIYKVAIDPLVGPMPYQGRELAFKLGLEGKLMQQFIKIFIGLINIFLEKDLSLIEINPLVITPQNNLICLDSKFSVDINALFRQPDLLKMHDHLQEDSREIQAAQWKLNYVSLDGNIGCIVNGAGLAMSTIDIINMQGGRPANFLDISGSADKKCIFEALNIIISDNNIKAILVNIFGGIIRCDLIAYGIIRALKKLRINIPIIVRFEGNSSEIGTKILTDSGLLNIILAKNITDAAKYVINEVNRENVHSSR